MMYPIPTEEAEEAEEIELPKPNTITCSELIPDRFKIKPSGRGMVVSAGKRVLGWEMVSMKELAKSVRMHPASLRRSLVGVSDSPLSVYLKVAKALKWEPAQVLEQVDKARKLRMEIEKRFTKKEKIA